MRGGGPDLAPCKPTMRSDYLSWVQFGDLHIRHAEDENYLDFRGLIEEANEHLEGEVDFAFLPGDNADDGTEEQYGLVRSALDRLKLPAHVIVGDHDRKSGTLDAFRNCLEPDLYRCLDLKGFRLLFLNAMDGTDSKTFDFGNAQLYWIRGKMLEAHAARLRTLIFIHMYPSELATHGGAFRNLIRQVEVEVVSMGHTHYNELANDGRTIYSATRSTGQIEEGPPGFSITAIDGEVVSWKFKERGSWPFVMITSPAEERLITRPHSPRHVLRDRVSIRANVWGARGANAASVTCSVDGAREEPMQFADGGWELNWNSRDVADGSHRIVVRAAHDGREAHDAISVLVNQAGRYRCPARSAVDYENVLGAYPEKSILGTQLGPNENGTKGPWPSWR